MGQKARDQINKTVDIMQEAVVAMKGLLKEGRTSDVSLLLVDSQDCAIAVGAKLEKLYGEGLETIYALESYCEQLYQISVLLEKETVAQATAELLQGLLNTLEQVRMGLSKEMKKEAVFMPYKASMWDSLESVWLAAKEDEDYIARVMPIPYFDKGKNGELKEMHWEGEMFPDCVPITHYESYDMDEHQPDMIFIHNPYDNYNHVTSIHPSYYSSKLKNYTDKLVYIPYFILDDVKPTDKAYIEQKKHYCLTPAVMNADTVIVQSEDMKQIYVNVLSEELGEQTRAKWEKKILGLGSPKSDKIMNTRKEDVEVPEEWMKIIQKPDGSWKKIIFYNIGLGAFLQNHEIMLDKIESVLKTFKENKDEVALLWRPHPLYKSTIEAMRPEYGTRYQAIVDKYKEEGWGIFDDTPDMNRAVALSDAYYGDHSSVARLYKQLGKLIMYQDPTIR
ncbi:MAG: hypothetical protein IJ958_10785 [Agathobacter sp.]|nr:hypothetical protein [Agathobacter sp.]